MCFPAGPGPKAYGGSHDRRRPPPWGDTDPACHARANLPTTAGSPHTDTTGGSGHTDACRRTGKQTLSCLSLSVSPLSLSLMVLYFFDLKKTQNTFTSVLTSSLVKV